MSQRTAVWQMLLTDAQEFKIPPKYLDILLDADINVALVAGHEPAEIAAYGPECHGLFLFRARIDEALLAALPNCQLLARVGTGYDAIDVQAAQRRGVMVTYIPDFCTEELSDHVMAFILGFVRQFPFLLAQAHDHRWLQAHEVPQPRRLKGRTLGILGFGHSGQRTAEKASALGMDVRVWTRTPRPVALARTGARESTFAEVMGCDFVSIHVSLSASTRGLIGPQELALMQPHAVLINIARGANVDTDALVEALQAKRLAGAALDVVQPAPLPPGHPLWSLPNVWLTSHSAAFSVEAGDDAWSTVVEDVCRVKQGRAPLNPVPELSGMQPGA